MSLEWCTAHLLLRTFPLYFAGIIRCYPPRARVFQRLFDPLYNSRLLSRNPLLTSETISGVLVIGYPMILLLIIIVGSKAFFVLKRQNVFGKIDEQNSWTL